MLDLYVKTHNQTGLKYLGMTTNPSSKYPGSGKKWKNHIQKHGRDISTQILLATEDKQEFRDTALFFSNLWAVETSTEWANCKPEEGQGNSSETSRKLALERVENGTHNFQGVRGTEQSKRNHREHPEMRAHLYGGRLQREVAQNRVKAGTHNLQVKGLVSVVDRSGKCSRITSEVYSLQTGPIESREYVHNTSKEAKKRRSIE